MTPHGCHWLNEFMYLFFLIVYEVVNVVLKQFDIVKYTLSVKDKTQLL